MLKKLLIILLTFIPIIVTANPSPFGLEIGKSTIKEVKAKYSLINQGINKYSSGQMFSIDSKNIQFNGLKKLIIIFDRNDKLVAVLATLPKNKFDSLYNNLGKKYQLVSKNIPFVGSKTAKFVDGKTNITLEAPHMSFDMNLNYLNKTFWQLYQVLKVQEQQEKQSHEQSQL